MFKHVMMISIFSYNSTSRFAGLHFRTQSLKKLTHLIYNPDPQMVKDNKDTIEKKSKKLKKGENTSILY